MGLTKLRRLRLLCNFNYENRLFISKKRLYSTYNTFILSGRHGNPIIYFTGWGWGESLSNIPLFRPFFNSLVSLKQLPIFIYEFFFLLRFFPEVFFSSSSKVLFLEYGFLFIFFFFLERKREESVRANCKYGRN